MKLILKTMERAAGRSMFLYFPEGPARTAFKRSVMTVFRDSDSEASVRALLEEGGLARLAEDEQIILAFPNPVDGAWNWQRDPYRADDMAFIRHIQGELNTETENRPAGAAPVTQGQLQNIMAAMFARMAQTWHPMNDVKYLAGIGSGASMACTVAALEPTLAAAVFAEGAQLAPATVKDAAWAPVPAYLLRCPEQTVAYFLKANGAVQEGEREGLSYYRNRVNPNQQMLVGSEGSIPAAYRALMRHVRRPNTGKYGDIERRMLPEVDYANFELHLDETVLSDGLAHTWFTHIPAAVKANPENKVPLMIMFHGASDNPAEAAEMSKFHELGEREGFITVYPWGTNKLTWNSDMTEGGPDDDAFTMALIDYMIANYPVDAGRVYLSGFSNGAAQAQVIGLCHPDRIAAVCPIDSNWPGNRMGVSEVDWHDVKPFRLAMELRERTGIDYRLPNWYTYGNREPSYPVYRGCTQQHQYDFWKLYNNIPIKPTPEMDQPHPCGCGVLGDRYERIEPSSVHSHHSYDVQRFVSRDPGAPNLFNYVVMLDKGHDIAEKDPELGWRFVSQFRRESDGSLTILK